MELRRILVPLDGSELAERALPLAEQLAQRAGAELILTRAPLARVFTGMDAIDATEAETNALREAETYLQAICTRTSEHGIPCQFVIAPSPTPDPALGQAVRPTLPFRQLAAVYREAAEAIAREAEALDVDLIVMATHGRSGLRRWVFGSVAMEIIQRASIPMLLVRSGTKAARAEPGTALPIGPDLRILVPLDGSAFGESALESAMALATLLGGSLVLVQVVPAAQHPGLGGLLLGPLGGDPIEHAALDAAARSYLEDVRKTLEGRGIHAESVVVEDEPAPAIIETARDRRCALIAVATHGRSGLARLGAGSVAEAVMTTAPSPVLVVHSSGLEDEQRLTTTTEEQAPAPGAAAAQSLRPAAAVSLTDDELEILQTALLTLRQTASREDHLAEPIQHLLDKLGVARAAVGTTDDGRRTTDDGR